MVHDYRYWLGWTQEGTPAEDEWQVYCLVIGMLGSIIVLGGVGAVMCNWKRICRCWRKSNNREMRYKYGTRWRYNK